MPAGRLLPLFIAVLLTTGTAAQGQAFVLLHEGEQAVVVVNANDREPAKRSSLSWKEIQIKATPPGFTYRGWFINDENLLALLQQ